MSFPVPSVMPVPMSFPFLCHSRAGGNPLVSTTSWIPAFGHVDKVTVADRRSINVGAARRLCLAVVRIHEGVGQGHPTPPLGVRFSTGPFAGMTEKVGRPHAGMTNLSASECDKMLSQQPVGRSCGTQRRMSGLLISLGLTALATRPLSRRQRTARGDPRLL